MNFKKDYINYVLHNVISSEANIFDERTALRNVLEIVIASDDIVKITFLIGKTVGLELLFKYILYISDKIDKSQVTIFNLKDNFDYDVQNLKKICSRIAITDSGSIHTPAETVPEIMKEEVITEEREEIEEEQLPVPGTAETEEEPLSPVEFQEESRQTKEMTLIENANNEAEVVEVFELQDISKSFETAGDEQAPEYSEDSPIEKNEQVFKDNNIEGKDTVETEDKTSDRAVEEVSLTEAGQKSEFEPDKNVTGDNIQDYFDRREPLKEEPVANEVYYRFENKFFEEVKILQKLFSSIRKETRGRTLMKINDRMLQSFTEIIELSSELADLSRQLSLDITADIFFTINLYFTRAIKDPQIVNRERIVLLNYSLEVVNSLIKGENYLEYDKVVEKLEQLKNEMLKPSARPAEKHEEVEPVKQISVEEKNKPEEVFPVRFDIGDKRDEIKEDKLSKPAERTLAGTDLEAVSFKLKYLVKEFEKVFSGLLDIEGPYNKFDILEKIDDLNNYLRIIAKNSSAEEMEDVLKLSEVSYVFLKYLKDYRMDLLDPEITQIIKYIIFTFKMLLTGRKPEDFNILVQYLNNPVKIFTDT
jgi:hypothetical protein